MPSDRRAERAKLGRCIDSCPLPKQTWNLGTTYAGSMVVVVRQVKIRLRKAQRLCGPLENLARTGIPALRPALVGQVSGFLVRAKASWTPLSMSCRLFCRNGPNWCALLCHADVRCRLHKALFSLLLVWVRLRLGAQGSVPEAGGDCTAPGVGLSSTRPGDCSSLGASALLVLAVLLGQLRDSGDDTPRVCIPTP